MKNLGLWAGIGVVIFALGTTVSIFWQISSDNAQHQPSAAASAPDSSAYAPKMHELTAKLASVGVASTWPSNGYDEVLRLDLPSTNPAIDDHAARSIALDAYNSFVKARTDSNIANPTSCIVHVYDDTGKQMAHAGIFGVSN